MGNFTWNYNVTFGSVQTIFTVTTADTLTNGRYVATAIFGTWDGQAITGLAAANTVFSNDNLLSNTLGTFKDGLDSSGIGFMTSDAAQNPIVVTIASTFPTTGLKAFAGSSNQSPDLLNGTSGVVTSYATTACFVTGTRILTDRGEVAVEALVVGDQVALAGGGFRGVQWVGHRHMAAFNEHDRPFCVRAHSFGRDLPARDLFISPEHAIFTEGVLIPVRHLALGDAIAQIDAEDICYYHILLDRHEVILAEGLACESLLDVYCETVFDNMADAPSSLIFLNPCAPRVTQGIELERSREKLRAISMLENAR
jgi:hypothetical protein